ncbi:MAG: biopolymer transporter ExbD [Cyanobacteria bacterium P01_F01_bin.150]
MRVVEYEQDDELEINIVPMIDVIFAILAFFILSTLFLTRAEGFPVNLPKAETSETQKKADFSVTIDEDGIVFLNKQEVNIKDLQTAISSQIGEGEESLVTIRADEKVLHGQVVQVMDILRSVDGARIGMATKPKPTSPAN